MTVATSPQTKALVPVGTWQVDRTHSSVEFEVLDLEQVRWIAGRFTDFDGKLVAREQGEIELRGTVRTDSVTTDDERRDAHLRSGDFFDAERNPEIRFESTTVEPLGEDSAVIRGRLVIAGAEREVALDAVQLGARLGLGEAERVVLRAAGKLDWGPLQVSVTAFISAEKAA